MQKARPQAFLRRGIALGLFVGIRFQVLFHSPPGVLFAFPSRYWFTIGHEVVFSLGSWSTRIPTGFLVSRGTWDTPRALRNFMYGAITRYGRPFQTFPLSLRVPRRGPATPRQVTPPRFRLFPFRSPLLRESLLISLPGGTEMFHFPPFASRAYFIQHGMAGVCPAGFPHSEIPGSKPVCGSPRLIAAYHVLHRLLVPRHPPYALSSLTIDTYSAWLLILSVLGTLYSVVKERKTLYLRAFIQDGPLVPPAFKKSPFVAGGGKRARTADLLVANQTLSQLSYTPCAASPRENKPLQGLF